MVETTTQHYGWTKPEIQHSPSTWGGFLNNDLDAIDSLVWTNQQGLAPIGSITMFAGATAPSNWLICNGQSLPHQTGGAYEALFAVIGYAYGGSGANFNLPNLVDRFAIGSGNTVALTGAGGEATHTLLETELASHAHSITDVAHNHGVNQWAHNHTDSGHTHAASASDSGHTHPLTGSMGGVAPGGGQALINAGGSNTGVGTANVSVTVYAGAATSNVVTSAISLNVSGTGLAATNADGGGQPHNNLPPYLGLNFIIRYT